MHFSFLSVKLPARLQLDLNTHAPREKVKKYVKKKEQSDTYLATDSRHCWSAQMMMKNDN